MNYKIRYARKNDFKIILKLGEKSWPTWWLTNYRFGAEHVKERIKEKRALVATVKEKIIGYALFGVIWSEMHLEDCFVEKEYRRMGIGSALLRKRIEIAKKLGFRKIISDCDVDNKVALKYHIRNGFKRCGYIKHLWGRTDSYILSRDL
jgi:ribosomal protein S18 acetylase RimI-like enzyme